MLKRPAGENEGRRNGKRRNCRRAGGSAQERIEKYTIGMRELGNT